MGGDDMTSQNTGTQWYYIHNISKGYLAEIDANGRSVWIRDLGRDTPLWMCNDYAIAQKIAHNRCARAFRVSDWLMSRVIPRRVIGN
jgi:hypothetical protein